MGDGVLGRHSAGGDMDHIWFVSFRMMIAHILLEMELWDRLFECKLTGCMYICHAHVEDRKFLMGVRLISLSFQILIYGKVSQAFLDNHGCRTFTTGLIIYSGVLRDYGCKNDLC